jgi:hypothetical protein
VNEMDKEKFNIILDKLLEKTEGGKLDWETTADKNTFLLILKDSAISASYSSDSGGFGAIPSEGAKGSYIFQFRNENGEIVEYIPVYSLQDKEGFEKAEKLFNLIKNKLIKVDNTVDRILQELAA